MGEKRGTKALETWCKRVTQGYPGVKVENMTTSWRDGMAFCAMIHHFRPDLIDFSSLDKSDILKNNEMAFRIAERHLGIPALLDAEDMAEYPVPDRLSILTYLSQFYQAFASNSASPIKKQSSDSPDTSLTSLSPSKVQHNPKMEGAPPWKEPCVVCDHAVFIAQRLRIDGKLYHRTCFRCARCDTQLSPADYYETHDGQFCCETCPDEDKMETQIVESPIDTRPPDDSPKSLVAKRKIMFDSYKDTDDAKLCDIVCNLDVKNEISIDDSSSELNSIVNNVADKIEDSPECVEFTDTSRRDSLEKSNLEDNVNLETAVHTEPDLEPVEAINPEIVNEVKIPKNPFEDDDEEEEEVKLETKSSNPFGSDSEDEEIESSTPIKATPKHVPSSNPFESDDEEESKPPKPLPRKSAQPSPQPFPRNKLRGSQMSLTSMSSMGSYTSPRKKKPAPPPPTSPYNTLTLSRSRKTKRAPLPPSLASSRLSLDSDVSSKDTSLGEPEKSLEEPSLKGEEIALEISNIAEQISIMVDAHNSKSSIPHESDEGIKIESEDISESSFEYQKKTIPQTPPPKPRRLEVSSEISTRSESPTPSASTSNIDSLNYQDELSSPTEKETKDSANMNKKISEEKSYTMPKSTHGQWRRKKAPAPPLPLPKRRNVQPMPIENIKQELYDIEIKQQGLERQGVTLENKIRDKFDTETSITPYVEELVLQLFELVNEKNELFRKQAELMYLRRQHHLEEEHAELEYQIRCLMARPENNKTDSDKETEEQLIQRLVEVVERRDAIVQCLEMDRLREAEEDKSISSSLDLTQDSEPKSSKKHKKKKDKRNSLKSLDLDKDLDESEKEVKKKKKWYSTLQHLKNKRL